MVHEDDKVIHKNSPAAYFMQIKCEMELNFRYDCCLKQKMDIRIWTRTENEFLLYEGM